MSHHKSEYVTQVLKFVTNFKRAHCEQLSNTNRARLRLWTYKLQDLEGVPATNDHFVTCSFALNSQEGADGADSCACNVPVIIKWKFDKLLKELNIQTL